MHVRRQSHARGAPRSPATGMREQARRCSEPTGSWAAGRALRFARWLRTTGWLDRSCRPARSDGSGLQHARMRTEDPCQDRSCANPTGCRLRQVAAATWLRSSSALETLRCALVSRGSDTSGAAASRGGGRHMASASGRVTQARERPSEAVSPLLPTPASRRVESRRVLSRRRVARSLGSSASRVNDRCFGIGPSDFCAICGQTESVQRSREGYALISYVRTFPSRPTHACAALLHHRVVSMSARGHREPFERQPRRRRDVKQAGMGSLPTRRARRPHRTRLP
jgi:hypothetical protein